jgi:hypothetical protein
MLNESVEIIVELGRVVYRKRRDMSKSTLTSATN